MSAVAGETQFGQGARYDGDDPALLMAALEAAFDYRGDVTLILHGGEELKGYLSNRSWKGAEPFVDILAPDAVRPRRVPCRSIRGVSFSGRDTASGKSWETWLSKYKAKMEAEARGEKVERIGLFPDALE
jgi:hypothetical protein